MASSKKNFMLAIVTKFFFKGKLKDSGSSRYISITQDSFWSIKRFPHTHKIKDNSRCIKGF